MKHRNRHEIETVLLVAASILAACAAPSPKIQETLFTLDCANGPQTSSITVHNFTVSNPLIINNAVEVTPNNDGLKVSPRGTGTPRFSVDQINGGAVINLISNVNRANGALITTTLQMADGRRQLLVDAACK